LEKPSFIRCFNPASNTSDRAEQFESFYLSFLQSYDHSSDRIDRQDKARIRLGSRRTRDNRFIKEEDSFIFFPAFGIGAIISFIKETPTMIKMSSRSSIMIIAIVAMLVQISFFTPQKSSSFFALAKNNDSRDDSIHKQNKRINEQTRKRNKDDDDDDKDKGSRRRRQPRARNRSPVENKSEDTRNKKKNRDKNNEGDKEKQKNVKEEVRVKF